MWFFNVSDHILSYRRSGENASAICPRLSSKFFSSSSPISHESPRSLFNQDIPNLTSTPITNKSFSRVTSNASNISMPSVSQLVNSTPKKTLKTNLFPSESPMINESSVDDYHDRTSQRRVNRILMPTLDDEYECHRDEVINYHDDILDDIGITKTILLELRNLV